jgi:UDP-3-O-[3-hydroxymyristoyl] glucosamine N-acyltransferase
VINLKLSDCFPKNKILTDGYFSHLDQTQTIQKGGLVYCTNQFYLEQAVKNPNVTAIITTQDLSQMIDGLPCVLSEAPRLDFYKLYQNLYKDGLLKPEIEFGRGSNCNIHPTATISGKTCIYDNVTIGPGAHVGDYVTLSNASYIGPGSVIGTDGFMPVWDVDGKAMRINHAGSVKIGENTTILANSVVVRSIFSQPTTIGNDCYIGHLSNIGHDVIIGNRCIIAGNCVIAGGSIIHDMAQVWSSSSVSHGCSVGEAAQVKLGSVVIHNISQREVVSGNFAYNHRKHTTFYLQHKK